MGLLMPSKYFYRLCRVYHNWHIYLLFVNFPLAQCQRDDYIWYEQTGSDYNEIAESDKNADTGFSEGWKLYMEIPFFFWLFLIMAVIWYLFVFRVLCCDKTCGNSDVAMGMNQIKSPVFTKRIK